MQVGQAEQIECTAALSSPSVTNKHLPPSAHSLGHFSKWPLTLSCRAIVVVTAFNNERLVGTECRSYCTTVGANWVNYTRVYESQFVSDSDCDKRVSCCPLTTTAITFRMTHATTHTARLANIAGDVHHLCLSAGVSFTGAYARNNNNNVRVTEYRNR